MVPTFLRLCGMTANQTALVPGAQLDRSSTPNGAAAPQEVDSRQESGITSQASFSQGIRTADEIGTARASKFLPMGSLSFR
jgi:hypothetical protein